MRYCKYCDAYKETSDFYKNKSCKDGISGKCKECHKLSYKKYYEDNKEKMGERSRKYHHENKEHKNEYSKQYYQDNRERLIQYEMDKYWNGEKPDRKEYYARYREKNREYINQQIKEYERLYPEKKLARVAKRRALKKDRTPEWLNKNQIKEMVSIYKQCSNLNKTTDEVYHVDHIIPLNGNDVCGLHVPWNLQIITKQENLTKANKLIEEYIL